MAKVISSDKYYKAMTQKLRYELGNDNRYKPGEIALAIPNLYDILTRYTNISNGLTYNGDEIKIYGTKMVAGMFVHSSIQSYEVAEDVTVVPDRAFAESKIKDIVLHDNITKLGEYCFEACTNLSTITLPSNLKEIGGSAFYGDYNLECEITMPNSLTKIGSSAFNGSAIKGNIVIPDGVTGMNIGSGAFCGTNISGVDIPSGITYLWWMLFYNCKKLTTLILRKSDSALNYGTSLLDNTPISNKAGYIYVPSILIDSYKTADGWSTYATQFRALEDYTIDGTTTGEFDYSKV